MTLFKDALKKKQDALLHNVFTAICFKYEKNDYFFKN